MKHTLLMLATLAVSIPGTLLNPFVGVAVYYGFATLYPQHLWANSLPDWRWSMIVGSFTVVSFFLHGLARSKAGARWPIEKKLMAILVVLTLLSVVDPINRELAYHQLDDFIKISVMFFVACSLLDSRYRLRVLTIVVVGCLGWVAFDFNQRYVFMGQKHILNGGFAGIDNNGIAAVMVMAMPLCMFLFTCEKKWFLKWPPLAAMLLMMHVVLFSFSRAGMLAMIVTLPVLLLRLKRRWVGFALTCLMLVAGLIMAGEPVRRRLATVIDYENDASAQIRLAVWRTSFEIMRDRPVLGVGPNCFRAVVGDYNREIKGRTAHNRFLQAAVDLGIPAAAVLTAALVLGLMNLQRIRRTHIDDPFVYDLANTLQVCLLAYVAVGMFASIGTIELPYIVLAMTVGLRNVVASEQPTVALDPTPIQRRKARLSLSGMKPATT